MFKKEFPGVPLLALTVCVSLMYVIDVCDKATATEEVQRDVQQQLLMTDCVRFKGSFNRSNLEYAVVQKDKNTRDNIAEFIKQHNSDTGIIYCLSKKDCEELAEDLQVLLVDWLSIYDVIM